MMMIQLSVAVVPSFHFSLSSFDTPCVMLMSMEILPVVIVVH